MADPLDAAALAEEALRYAKVMRDAPSLAKWMPVVEKATDALEALARALLTTLRRVEELERQLANENTQ